jgi:cytosine/adenosine deaminase-related metal-dependent hydrolase
MELIAHQSGPFVDFLTSVGAWHPTGLIGPLWTVLTGNRNAGKLLLAHCNYFPLEDMAYFGFDMSVVYCPRTHAAFGHPPHPFREFLAGRVRVCLGTDGLSSNPDLDPLAEARFVHGRYPDFSGDTLLRMITLSGAEALGWADETGSLEPGKSADLVVVPLPDEEAADPHALLFCDHPGDRRTMFRGQWRE